jgi:glycosyltransferase involved in cell wall biosynthesis
MKPTTDLSVFNDRKPLVSVVIPVYNTSDYVLEAVDSVFAQTLTDYELIIVNDGSPDTEKLEQVLQPYLSRIAYIKQENRGLSGARNAGIGAARGTFYAQLDADDLWEPDYLETQLGYLQRNQTIDLVYPNALIFNEGSNDSVEFMKVSPSHGEPTFERLVRQQCTVMYSITARMEAIKRVGMFDESLRSCEDFDLWLRLLKQGARIGYHQKILVRYRRRPGSLSSDRAWMTSTVLRVLAKAESTLQLTPSERNAVQEESVRRRARLNVLEGKKALAKGETETAIHLFREANGCDRSLKLCLALWALRYWPSLVNSALSIRSRWFSRSDRNILTGLD